MTPKIWIDRQGFFRSAGAEVLYLPQPVDGEAKCIIRSNEADYERLFSCEYALRDVLNRHAQIPGVMIDVDALVEFAMERTTPKPSKTRQKKSAQSEDWLDRFL